MNFINENIDKINISAHLASSAIALSLVMYYIRKWSNKS